MKTDTEGPKTLKAQASIIIILAVIIMATVAIALAWQKFFLEEPLEPGGIGELQYLLKQEIEDKIYAGAYQTLNTIGDQGGYLDMPSPAVDFGQGRVSYWQICQHGFIPSIDNVTEDVKEGLKRILNAWEIREFEGKPVVKSEINASDVEVVMSRDHIIFRVWMPVKLQDRSMGMPFTVTIATRFKDMYEFAKGFIEDNLEERYFESFIGSLIFHSYENVNDIKNPSFLPNQGVLAECGQVIYKNWDDVKRVISMMVDYALINLIFWQNSPMGTGFLNYYIPDVNGKQYIEYQVDFFPMGELTQENLQPTQNPIIIKNNKVFHKWVPGCMKEYDVRYSWYQPIVMRITDPNNNSIRLGVLPYIYKSAIGSCSVEMAWNTTPNPCQTGKCHAKLKFTDNFGNPLEGVKASFGQCQIGSKTGPDGIVEGAIPCGVAELNAYHSQYIAHYDLVSSQELENARINLTEMPLLLANFYAFRVTYDKPVNHYPDPFLGLVPFEGTDCLKDMLCCNYQLDREIINDEFVIAYFKRENPMPWELEELSVGNIKSDNTSVSVKTIDYLPPGLYNTSSELIEPALSATTGVIEGQYMLKELPTTRDVYVSVPVYSFVPKFGFDSDDEYAYYRDRLLELMQGCGIGHVSDEQAPSECRLYTWCQNDGGLKTCTSGNKALVLNPLLSSCGLSASGTISEKVERLETRCGIRVRFKDIANTEASCR